MLFRSNQETLIKAKERGLIKDGATNGKELLKNADLTIISIYPKLLLTFIKENKEYFKEGSVITDATGIKEMFIDDVMKILPQNIDFVFGHPMAGREKKGIDFASSTVFKGANYIITPINKNKEKNLNMIENLAYEIGFGKVNRITPKYHDEMIGYTSQLPHIMAVALINSDCEKRDTGSFIGDSYRDLTRIANINEELWTELFLGNKKNLLKSIDEFEKQLNILKNAVNSDDKDTLVSEFIKSTSRREKLVKINDKSSDI